jgi:hypothetical protein
VGDGGEVAHRTRRLFHSPAVIPMLSTSRFRFRSSGPTVEALPTVFTHVRFADGQTIR